MVSRMPRTSSISQLMVPSPSTSVVSPFKPSVAGTSGVIRVVMKSRMVGVSEQDAPVSITIGSSLFTLDTYIAGFISGISCL